MSYFKERNKRVISQVLTGSKEAQELREGFKRRFGFEMTDGKNFPVLKEAAEKRMDVNPGFSFQKLRESLPGKLREADTSSAFVQLLRAGIQLVVNNMYEVSSATFEEWTTVVPSKKDTEPYAPLFGIGFPGEVAKGGLYTEVGAMGADQKLKNRKYGSMYAAEWELTEDDQTGQIMRSAQIMGEYMKLVVEVVVHGKLASVSGGSTYANLTVGVSETKPSYESNWPFGATLFGGGSNMPGSFALLSQPNIQAAFIALRQQKNPLGLKMEVDPDCILCGPKYEFDSAVLANSAYYPSVAGTTAGVTGGQFAINPLKGKFDTVISKYHFKNDGTVDDGTGTMWYAIDKKKTANGAFIVQMRESASVINEAVNSGESFNRDLIRFKARSRFNADFIEPRFMYRGNDGSVTS
jgi:hypothetical protein